MDTSIVVHNGTVKVSPWNCKEGIICKPLPGVHVISNFYLMQLICDKYRIGMLSHVFEICLEYFSCRDINDTLDCPYFCIRNNSRVVGSFCFLRVPRFL